MLCLRSVVYRMANVVWRAFDDGYKGYFPCQVVTNAALDNTPHHWNTHHLSQELGITSFIVSINMTNPRQAFFQTSIHRMDVPWSSFFFTFQPSAFWWWGIYRSLWMGILIINPTRDFLSVGTSPVFNCSDNLKSLQILPQSIHHNNRQS